jgi:hypothetical protein
MDVIAFSRRPTLQSCTSGRWTTPPLERSCGLSTRSRRGKTLRSRLHCGTEERALAGASPLLRMIPKRSAPQIVRIRGRREYDLPRPLRPPQPPSRTTAQALTTILVRTRAPTPAPTPVPMPARNPCCQYSLTCHYASYENKKPPTAVCQPYLAPALIELSVAVCADIWLTGCGGLVCYVSPCTVRLFISVCISDVFYLLVVPCQYTPPGV